MSLVETLDRRWERARDTTVPLCSFEFFPPKTDMGMNNLMSRIGRMAKLDPTFVTVTWGAGGSTARRSLDLANACQNLHNLTTCLHLTCTNMDVDVLRDSLATAKKLGIRNILALRGDPPRDPDDDVVAAPAMQQSFQFAVDLVSFIRAEYGHWFCIGVAVYPEGHLSTSNFEDDIPFLIEKVKAGADFLITQLFFDASLFLEFEAYLRRHPSGIFKTIPIIPAIMPIQTFQSLLRIRNLSQVHMPDAIMERLQTLKADDAAVKEYGVKIACSLVRQIQRGMKDRFRGVHFCTLNLEKSVVSTLEFLEQQLEDEMANGNHLSPPNGQRRKSSRLSGGVQNKVIVDQVRSEMQNLNILPQNVNQAIEDEGESNHVNTVRLDRGGREAVWDEFPNGRYGDVRSPAYGSIENYGAGSPIFPPNGRSLWGAPVTVEDISNLFISYLTGKLSLTPFGDEPIRPETSTIREALVDMNRRGFWTISSQPAVNGVKSDHPVHGWGPKGGWVYQKPFVELFVHASKWAPFHKSLQACGDAISFHAANLRGDYHSNMEESDTNAVTWGVFPGQEIVQPTMVEEVSFLAWKEEAFDIWQAWMRLYSANSPTAKFLSTIRDSYWLVNIIHHDFQSSDTLWELLSEWNI